MKSDSKLIEEIEKLQSKVALLEARLDKQNHSYEMVVRSSNEWKRMFDLVPNLIFIVDNEHRIVKANKPLAERLTLSTDECIGLHCHQVVHGLESPPDYCPCFKTITDEVANSTEMTLERLGGVFNVTTSPFADEEGNTIGSVHVLQDITDRKRTEKALRDSEVRFRSLSNMTIEGIVIHRDGTIILANQAFADLINVSDPNFVTGKFGPDVLPMTEQSRIDLIESIQSNSDDTLDIELIKPDGSVAIVETFGRAISYQGEEARLVYLRDVTDQKKGEAERGRLILAIEQAMETVIITDTNGLIQYVNPAFESVTGYSCEEVLGENPRILKSGKQDVAFYSMMWKTLSNGETWRGEIVNRKKNGSLFTEEASISPVRDAMGNTINYVAVKHDITKRKQAEEALRESEIRLFKFINSATDGFTLWDSEFNLIELNKTELQFYPKGTKREDLIGRNAAELVPNMKEVGRYDKYMEVIKTGTPLFMDGVVPDKKFGDKIFSIRAFKVGDGLGVISTDITERKRAEDTLRKSEERYRLLATNTQDTIWMTDLEFNITYVNDAIFNFLGYTAEQFTGLNPEAFTPPEGLAVLHSAAKQLFAKYKQGEISQIKFEIQQYRRDRTLIDVEITANLLEGHDGKLIGFQGRSLDISERKRAQTSLQKSEKRFRDLADLLPQVIFEMDLKGNLTYVNRNGFETFGYKNADFDKGVNIFSVIPPEDRDRVKKGIRSALKGESYGSPEFTGLRKDRSRFPMMVYTSPVVDEGTLDGLRGIVVDISDQKIAEEKLRDSEKKIRSIVEHSSNIYYSHTPEHVLTYLSPQIEDVLGFTVEEALGRWTDLMSDNPVNQKGYDITNRAIQTGIPQPSYELELIHKNGDKVWVEINEEPEVVNGKTVSIVGALTDITERKRTELLARIQKELALELNKVADVNNAIVLCIEAAIKVSDADCGEIYLVDDDTGDYKLIYHKDIRSDVDRSVFSAIPIDPRGKSIKKKRKVNTDQLALNIPSEDLQEADEITASAVIPLVNEGEVFGSLRVASYTLDDISELNLNALELINQQTSGIIVRMKAEEKLRASEERYRRLFEDDLAGNYVSTSAGKIITCNLAFARIFGYDTVDEVLMKGIDSFYIYEQDREEFLRLLEGGGKLEFYEKDFRHKDGHTLHIIENAVGVFDESGELTQIRGHVIDNTDRKQLEDQLRQAQKMEGIGRLAGGIAHDFNNLMTAIICNTELSLMDLDSNDPLQKNMKEVQATAERAGALTSQLLAFSRKQSLQPRILNLNIQISEIKSMLLRTIGEDIDLIVDLEDDLWMVQADPGQIDQVLVNLIVNARDAMPENGELTIETQNVVLDAEYTKKHPFVQPGEFVMLAVSDSGVGMTEDVRTKIFEPFFTTKHKAIGTGLGLSTVYGIIKQSDGFINVYSELGKGSTFKIYLPMVSEKADIIEKTGINNHLPRGDETILLVEDESTVRKAAVKILKRQGYQVTEVDSGFAALILCQRMETQVDLVITDVIMPFMSGIEFIDELKKIWTDVKVLFISGYTENATIHKDILTPGIPFLKKPFRPLDIALKVREVLDQ